MKKILNKLFRLISKMLLILIVAFLLLPIYFISYSRYNRKYCIKAPFMYYLLVNAWFTIKTFTIFDFNNTDYNSLFTNFKIQSYVYEDKKNIYEISDKIQFKNYLKKLNISVNPTIDIISNYRQFKKFFVKKGYVFKCNHDSGSTIFSRNPDGPLISYILLLISKNINYGIISTEWQYIPLQRKIFVEKKLDLPNDDYKFFCVNGVVKMIHCIYDRSKETKQATYDRYGNNLELELYPNYKTINSNTHLKSNILQKINIVENLAKKYKFMRIDLYISGEEQIVGEFTLTPQSGVYMGKDRDEVAKILELKNILWVS